MNRAMNLLIWRHAEAEDGLPDLERPLTPRGRRQAKAVAPWIDRNFPKDGRILVSPALRTRQTADALGRAYDIEPGIAPGTAYDRVLDAIGLPACVPAKEEGSLLVVGHQPWVGQVLRLLLTGQRRNWSVRKAAVWWLTYREGDEDGEEGSGEWVLRAVTDPGFVEKS